VTGLAQAAFEHIAHAQRASDLLHIRRAGLNAKDEFRAMTNREGYGKAR
jgi:hypothetical protein